VIQKLGGQCAGMQGFMMFSSFGGGAYTRTTAENFVPQPIHENPDKNFGPRRIHQNPAEKVPPAAEIQKTCRKLRTAAHTRSHCRKLQSAANTRNSAGKVPPATHPSMSLMRKCQPRRSAGDFLFSHEWFDAHSRGAVSAGSSRRIWWQ
jgi:hypothetical protein